MKGMFERLAVTCCLLVASLVAGCAPAPVIRPVPRESSCRILRPIPPPLHFYQGADDDAQATSFDPSDETAFVELNRRVLANPEDVDALVARGYAHARRAERVQSEKDFTRARMLGPDRTRVYWSEGWARFALGDPACAIESWQHAGALLGGDAFWLSYTLALGYWELGETDAALAYYDSAAGSMPQRFASLWAVDAYTRKWAPAERRAIREIAVAAIARWTVYFDSDSASAPRR